MRRVFITFRSITPAQQGQRMLHRGGVETVLQRTPRMFEQRGCGYCLRLHPKDLEQALQLLQNAGVPYQKVFAREGEALEELVL